METPIQDVDVSASDPWVLRPRDLSLWMMLILLVGAWPAIGRVRFASASEIRVQTVSRNGTNRLDVLNAATWRLDINSATQNDLEMLPGVGASRAKAILQERHKRGAFQSIWDLSDVPGVTKALIQRLEPLLRAVPTADHPTPPLLRGRDHSLHTLRLPPGLPRAES